MKNIGEARDSEFASGKAAKVLTSAVKTLKSLGMAVSFAGVLLLSACGGSGGSGPVATYNVSANAGTGGSISPSSATVSAGRTTQFSVTPQSGYAISAVAGCGGTLSGSTYTTGTINANCTVTASFVAQYTVTATAGTGGTISPSGATVDSGGTTTFTVTANGGYAISAVTGCGGTLSGSTYTTGTINVNCTVAAKFVATWIWVGGSDKADAPGVYGTQGVAAASNMPGAHFTSATWADASGNLWLFGGTGRDATDTAGDLSDLWKYSIASGEWTWVGGSDAVDQAGVYGTQDLAAASNTPGARNGAVTWVDSSGNLWLFGGRIDQAQSLSGYWNDLWKFSPASGEWTWVGGSNSEDQKGVYGTKGVAAASNMPGARSNATVWTDASGNVWLFGGWGYDSAGNVGDLNDLWKYSPASGEWTWVGGSDIENQSGSYGTEGVAAAANMPSARNAAVTWVDTHGNVWLFGGWGVDSTGGSGFLNDLWKYSPASGEWTWVGGPTVENQWGVYGTRNVSATSNMPGARCCEAAWTDANGNLWLFGGAGYDSVGTQDALNDLWKYPTQ